MVRALRNFISIALLLIAETSSRNGRPDHATNTLCNNDHQRKGEISHPVLAAFLKKHGECHCRIEVPTTYLAEDLDEYEHGEGNALRRRARHIAPVDGHHDEGRADDLGEQHVELIVVAAGNFHLI